MSDANSPEWLRAARASWRWRGNTRPDFAVAPKPGQESVWDYPRPPVIERDGREIVVAWGHREIVRTCSAVRVLETSHPPTYYLPLEDTVRKYLTRSRGSSFCEWKGPASYWSLVDGSDQLRDVAWSYLAPLAGAELLADCIAFYPSNLRCTVGGEPVSPQPGGFYGGWITPDLCGPFKGDPGSQGW